MRTNGITEGERLFPVRFSWRTSSRALAMLSGMFASPAVALPSSSPGSGRKGFKPCSPGWSDNLLVSDRLMELPGPFPWVDDSIASGLLERTGSFSSSAANGLDSAVVEALGFLGVDLMLLKDEVQRRLNRAVRRFFWSQ